MLPQAKQHLQVRSCKSKNLHISNYMITLSVILFSYIDYLNTEALRRTMRLHSHEVI